jgi:hypothetical protein
MVAAAWSPVNLAVALNVEMGMQICTRSDSSPSLTTMGQFADQARDQALALALPGARSEAFNVDSFDEGASDRKAVRRDHGFTERAFCQKSAPAPGNARLPRYPWGRVNRQAVTRSHRL